MQSHPSNLEHANKLIGSDLVFQVQGKTAFDVPLSQVANSNIAGKYEVALEFNPPSNYKFDPKDLNKRPPDEMVEMRFYIPGKSMKKAGSDAGSGGEETELDEEGNEVSAADAFHSLIKEKADIGAVVGDSIVVFEDCLILTPRQVLSLAISSKRSLMYLQRPILYRSLRRLHPTSW